MNRFFKAYSSFTKAERAGITALLGLLCILVIIRLTLHLWVHPAYDKAEEQKLITAWEKYERSQPLPENAADTSGSGPADDYSDAYDDNDGPMPGIINLNTADSATLVRLRGIGPATAAKIIQRRKSKGPFTAVGQLLEIRSIPAATFSVLEKHLTVGK